MASTTRTFKVVGAAAAVMAVMVLSASSAEIDLWTDPEPGTGEPVTEVDTQDRATPPPPEDEGDRLPSEAGPVMDLLAGVIVVILMATVVMAAARPHQWQLSLGRPRPLPISAGPWPVVALAG